jgi:hypothetical protein
MSGENRKEMLRRQFTALTNRCIVRQPLDETLPKSRNIVRYKISLYHSRCYIFVREDLERISLTICLGTPCVSRPRGTPYRC